MDKNKNLAKIRMYLKISVVEIKHKTILEALITETYR